MIEICNAYKRFVDKEVIKNINIKVDKGQIYGLIGANGAGKTTLIKAMTGIWRLDSGSISIDNQEVYENPSAKRVIGYVPDQSNYYNSYRVKDMKRFYQMTYENFDNERYTSLNEILRIEENKFIRELSKGMKTRLSILLNLSIMPKVLILDEPTSGLDAVIKKEVFNTILKDVEERGTTVLISSHNISDLERICDSVGIIDGGEIKYSSSIEEMKRNVRKIQVVFNGEAPLDLKEWKEIMSVEQIGRVFYLITKEYSGDLEKRLYDSNVNFVEQLDLSLEDMFIYAVGGDKYGQIL